MTDEKLFSVGDFAKLSRATHATLHHYDRIGLLSPVLRGENNYRYYSSGQLAVVNVIRIMQQLGLTLDEIKALRDKRTPEYVYDIFLNHVEIIDKKIENWVRARKLLLTLQQSIKSAMSVDESDISIQFLPVEAIILGNLNDYSEGRNAYDALISFYHDMHEQYPELNLNYPVWGTYSPATIAQGGWNKPDRFYFYNPEGYDKRPAGLYAIGYRRGAYGHTDALYTQMLDYISQNGFEICGNAYEEYPLNEVCITDEENYLIRVLIAVREKSTSPGKE